MSYDDSVTWLGGDGGGYGSANTQTSAGDGWWANNGDTVQNWLGAGLGAYNAYNAYQGAQDQRDFQRQAMQPQQSDQMSGWNLGGPLQGMYDYFASEIPNIYQWTAQQYGNMGGGGQANQAAQGLANDMADYARSDDPLMQAGSNYLSNTVSGNSMNPFLNAAFGEAQGGMLSDYYNRVMGGFGGGGGGGGYGGGGGSGGGALLDPSQHQQFLENWSQGIMNDPLAGEWAQRLAEQSTNAATDQYNQATAAANRNAEMSGAYGSSGLVNQRGVNAGQFGQGLYDAQTMAAMAALDRALDGSGQAASMQNTLTGANASITNANTGARASNYGANMGLQGQLAGYGLQAALGRQGYMGDLANMFGQSQDSAAGMIPGYHNVRMDDLARAFGAQNQLGRQGAARASRQAQMPWGNLGNAIGYMNQLTPFMGDRYSQSIMPGQFPTGGFANPGMAAVGGGIQGYQDIMSLFGGQQGAA